MSCLLLYVKQEQTVGDNNCNVFVSFYTWHLNQFPNFKYINLRLVTHLLN